MLWNGYCVATVVLGLKQVNFKARLQDLRSFLFKMVEKEKEEGKGNKLGEM